MRNRIAQQRQRDHFEKAARQERGEKDALLMFTSTTATRQRISDISKLPTEESNVTLQDTNPVSPTYGLFYFMPGYSTLDGPDILG